MAIPANSNVTQNDAEEELNIRVHVQYKQCVMISAKIGTTGIVTKNLNKNLQVIPEKHPTDSLRKTAILRTSHIVRKVLQSEI